MSVLHASVGDQGANLREDVLTVQTLLRTKGYDPGPIDGICGPKTITAVRKFQANFLKQPDGLVEHGRKTWLMLTGAGVVASPILAEWSGDSENGQKTRRSRACTRICDRR